MALELVRRLRGALPQGRSLPDEVWRGRHRWILVLLWAHVAGLAVLAWLHHPRVHGGAAGVAGIALAAALATLPWGGRRWRSTLATVGLLGSSATLVLASGGTAELHLHFLVALTLVMLYQDGFGFLVAVGFVVVYYGVVGTMVPTAVYDQPQAWQDPGAGSSSTTC